MTTTTIHREDVKALLRKRYGSLESFAAHLGIESQAVRDLLRGKSNSAKDHVAREMGVEPDHLIITSGNIPICGSHTKDSHDGHRLNAGAK